MRYIGVSDCKMQEGSMRCDVNISVREVGSDKLGTRTEIREYELNQLYCKGCWNMSLSVRVDILENGGKVIQETLRYDDVTNTTSSMRGKEDANDYRYFRDPDLVTINVSREEVEELRNLLPELPVQKAERYVSELGLSETDAALLTKYRKIAEFYEEASEGTKILKLPQTSLSVRFSADLIQKAIRKLLILKLVQRICVSLLSLLMMARLR